MTDHLNPRHPSEIALDLGIVEGWRAPVKDFTGVDPLDLEREAWFREHGVLYARGCQQYLRWRLVLRVVKIYWGQIWALRVGACYE